MQWCLLLCKAAVCFWSLFSAITFKISFLLGKTDYSVFGVKSTWWKWKLLFWLHHWLSWAATASSTESMLCQEIIVRAVLSGERTVISHKVNWNAFALHNLFLWTGPRMFNKKLLVQCIQAELWEPARTMLRLSHQLFPFWNFPTIGCWHWCWCCRVGDATSSLTARLSVPVDSRTEGGCTRVCQDGNCCCSASLPLCSCSLLIACLCAWFSNQDNYSSSCFFEKYILATPELHWQRQRLHKQS